MNPTADIPGRIWRQVKEFSGLGGEATYLWPRWILLRAVGIVYLFVFAGIIAESQALIGPHGLVPATGFLGVLRNASPNAVAAFLRAPGLLWISSDTWMIAGLGWVGMAAAVAVVLNLWPRMALFVCWLSFLSYVTVFLTLFSATFTDPLVLEAALLCVPFAPKGFRPSLGASSPPRPIALFMVRWMLFRVMLESGLTKLIAGDPHWRNFTAMDVMYETAPFPTILAFLDHQLPPLYHFFEVALTFVAELVAPFLAVFGGRRGRWIAFVSWTLFQLGIELTANFGWLNVAAMGLGVALLDDQMLASAARRLRLHRLGNLFAAAPANLRPTTGSGWRLWTLRSALWIHFGLTLYAFEIFCTNGTLEMSDDVSRPLRYAFLDFRSANAYTLYAKFHLHRVGVEFSGSNDGGVTWRSYQYPHLPQEEDQISPFVAPRFLRFEAAAQIMGENFEKAPFLPLVASHLIARNPIIMTLFKSDPFPDRPATMMRLRRFQLTFTDLATYRSTGRFWTKKYLGEYGSMMYVNREGKVVQSASPLEAEQVKADAGNPSAQNNLGFIYLTGNGAPKDPVAAVKWFRLAAEQGLASAQFNLATLYADGEYLPASPVEAARWYSKAAEQGWVDAQLNLGLAYAKGDGVPPSSAEAAKWYRRAALQGSVPAQSLLGSCYDAGDGVPKDDVEALVWFGFAAAAGDADSVKNRAVLEARGGPAGVRAAAERSRQILIRAERPGDTP